MAAVRVGYVAFSEDKATEISEIAKVGKITPDTFGPPHQYVPLTDEPGTAVEKAIFSLALPQVAVKPTEWFILKIIMSEDHVIEAIKKNQLVRCPEGTHNKKALSGWRFYGEIALGGEDGVAYKWLRLTLPAMGIPIWADKVLSGTYYKNAFGTCAGCGSSSTPVWAGAKAKRQGNGKDVMYCCNCWHSSISEEADDDIQRHAKRRAEHQATVIGQMLR